MGYEFAVHVNQYLEQQGMATRSIAKIDSNPAKSKHLETATTKLFDQEVDFCNLRTEVYDEDSRIPSQITFGTPTEDAYRRDTTINSLFYNINTHSVEDLTSQGLPDLASGTIRTPLSPYETFREDPLRVMRCIRFASRFNFTLVPELLEAAKDVTIKDALVSKISKERIGTELEKMITGPSPALAIHYIHDLGLYSTVFDSGVLPPCPASPPVQDPRLAVRAVDTLQWLLVNHLPSQPENQVRLLYYGAALLPFLNVFTVIKKKKMNAVQLVLRDALKATNHDSGDINTLFRGIPILQQAVQQQQHSPISRPDLGMIIRDIGPLWSTSLHLALLHTILTSQPDWHGQAPAPAPILECIHDYQALYTQVYDYAIQDAHAWRPLMDGKKATQLLGVKPGPIVQELMHVMMYWQLEHPDSTVEDCAEMLKTYWVDKQS
ncbi:poly A polymerase C-terminal region-like protein [Hesseltinella vesiculosa]|uniref:Poly A polymerase C-terminal region-like protein n=1 Tax=Hesseltinella vesiculosa TaxID=101127 RepID=A0A1X2GWS2_9FUNG|nr:poly A polymerase C-terminal region-like protein [Hesseltinella vesiculosa]